MQEYTITNNTATKSCPLHSSYVGTMCTSTSDADALAEILTQSPSIRYRRVDCGKCPAVAFVLGGEG